MTDVLIPTLETDRLVLRAPVPADVAPFAAFYASDAAKYVGGPLRDFQVWRYTAEVIGHWQLRGFGRWMVERKDAPGAIGLIGLHAPPDWPEPEVGWMLWDGNGKGYAAEAARAARDYAWNTLGLTTLISSIAPENAASIRVAEGMGARREAQGFEHPLFGTMAVWRHPAPEALS
ncbi:GNAT family N-acetyltransferase [Roseobacter ponti]|uniref:GNAT family N-acetyltransferase n=1 Tax=Roseobacter ponti TaxID=1891787 RepID=A0A858SYS8_9RHOB|nr:GNAT family N-acetyltransferase [Roseobacter ponti]QJF52651.1 GNAT family N-acetyltransferase [Roseobacter ponti]